MVSDRWWVLKLSLEGENKSEGDLTSKVIVLGKNLERKSNRAIERQSNRAIEQPEQQSNRATELRTQSDRNCGYVEGDTRLKPLWNSSDCCLW